MTMRARLSILVPCLVLSVAACGKKTAPPPEPTKAAPTTEPTKAPEPTTAPTMAPADDAAVAPADDAAAAPADDAAAAPVDDAAAAPADDAAAAAPADDAAAAAPADDAAAAPVGPAPVFDTAGFSTPESVLVVTKGDYYLVSNINGAPLDKDDNGFLSKVGADGKVLELKWIDGASEAVELNAPKGMAIVGDALFVADIDTVRKFDLTSGAPLGAYPVKDAAFLNDVAASADGWVYVTDSGIGPDFKPHGTPGVYMFRDGKGEEVPTMMKLEDVGLPNGVFVEAGEGGDTLYLNGFDDSKMLRIWKHGETKPTTIALPVGQLDGIDKRVGEDADKNAVTTWYVSSWETGGVYALDAKGTSTALVTGLKGPADFVIDQARGIVIVPVFMENRVVAYKL